uniref:Uncharacterized protein n=1 Tax=Trieres chinensis TaxID=1514140 RepID=A0A7S2EG54_TRICV|mmetsp:Transcript_21617/g.43686  ORF Transcript_21617/g.43686 Transcript_21617/m.43686 type:complete len:431 (+) Transcript_21617:75-1367(+)
MAVAEGPIVSRYLAECDHPPAQKLEDCIVRFDRHDSATKRKRSHSEKGQSTESKDCHDILHHAVKIFLSSGCCIIPNALPETFVKECKSKAVSDLELLNQELQSRRVEAAEAGDSIKLASACRVDYREVVDRDGLRRDVRFELDKFPFSASGLVYNNKVFPLIKELLGGQDKVNLLYAGVMWARRCSSTENKDEKKSQKWHADGGHCFEHAHQPPHCINVFFPLINLTSKHGPTEVKPGSQRLGHFDDPSHASFGLEAEAGDAILFDYRLKHRGGINVSDSEDRPILYLAYSKPWFRDFGNTRSATSIFKNPCRSSPWISRLLAGEAMGAMEGFESTTAPCGGGTKDFGLGNNEGHAAEQSGNDQGSGEQWVLFKMNVQLDGDHEETIIVHSGDVASEIATQFCRKHQLSSNFMPMLAETIQQQISQVTK